MGEEPKDGLDDEALVRAHLADPDGTAATALIARWQDRVYQWAYRVVRDHDAALDVAQDALLSMYRNLPAYKERGRFGAWLFTIVHNRARSEVRRRPLIRDPEIDLDFLATPGPGPDEQLDSAEWERRLLDTMNRVLEPEERAALWLRSFERLGMEDITQMLKLENATGARGVLQSARRKLRRALGRDGDFAGEGQDG
jgi:RNA polymerase sigma-70 factor (ECF subfamily)